MIALQPIVREANYLFERLCYTSLCTRCGQQETEVFSLLLSTEVMRKANVLPVSKATELNAHKSVCNHSTVLIGKRSFWVSKSFEVATSEAGAPSGWDFKGMDLPKTFSELQGMHTGAVLGHMHALVKARERGDPVSPTLLTDPI